MASIKNYLAVIVTSLSLTYPTACTAPSNENTPPKIIEFQDKEGENNLECYIKPVVDDFNKDGLYDICFPNVPPGGLTCAIDYNRDCKQDLVIWTSSTSNPKIYPGKKQINGCLPNLNFQHKPDYKTVKNKL